MKARHAGLWIISAFLGFFSAANAGEKGYELFITSEVSKEPVRAFIEADGGQVIYSPDEGKTGFVFVCGSSKKGEPEVDVYVVDREGFEQLKTSNAVEVTSFLALGKLDAQQTLDRLSEAGLQVGFEPMEKSRYMERLRAKAAGTLAIAQEREAAGLPILRLSNGLGSPSSCPQLTDTSGEPNSIHNKCCVTCGGETACGSVCVFMDCGSCCTTQ